MSERVALATDLLDRVARRLCRQGGATWPRGQTQRDLATVNAYEQLAWAAADEVMAWQAEQAVAAAGPDPFLKTFPDRFWENESWDDFDERLNHG